MGLSLSFVFLSFLFFSFNMYLFPQTKHSDPHSSIVGGGNAPLTLGATRH